MSKRKRPTKPKGRKAGPSKRAAPKVKEPSSAKKSRTSSKGASRATTAKTKGRSKGSSRSSAIDLTTLSLRQAVRIVAEHLENAGYDPVLTGSSCAALYAGGAIHPSSMEFVVSEYNAAELGKVMGALGFRRVSMNHYESAKSPYDVVFLPPPLAVGDDVIREPVLVPARPGKIRLLNVTDSVRQRLSMFYRWGDRKALDEAVVVARKQSLDMELIRRWSEWEWCTDKYDEFLGELGHEK